MVLFERRKGKGSDGFMLDRQGRREGGLSRGKGDHMVLLEMRA